jgi:acetylornithine deacetylase/succinyl-diaminopimelate desuccinylase-like protein
MSPLSPQIDYSSRAKRGGTVIKALFAGNERTEENPVPSKPRSDLVAILSDLIALPSPYPPGTSVEICAYAAAPESRLKSRSPADQGRRTLVVARMKGKGKVRHRLQRHVDTVGVGEEGPTGRATLQGAGRGGLVHGLGASNCKSSIAVSSGS